MERPFSGFARAWASRTVRAVVAVLLAVPASLAADATGTTERTPGLQKAVFRTPDGSVTVHLPDDARAGDSLSGVVVVEPEGDSEKKRTKSQDRLDGLVVEMEGQRNDVNRGQARWTIPAAAEVVLRLLDPKGRELARTSLPVQCGSPHEFAALPGVQEDVAETVLNLKQVRLGSGRPSGLEPGQKVTPDDFRLPATGQTGRSVTCDGPFDGDLGTTAVTVGGKPVRLLAESPRKLVFESPQDVTGVTTLRLKERDVESEAAFRNVAVRLSAPTTRLSRGQTTTLGIAVEGLAGLAEEIPLELRKSGVVSMAGGDEQVIAIKPSDVGSDGRCAFERTLTGLAAGDFNVVATVTVPEPAIRLTAPVDGAAVSEPRPTFAWTVDHPPAGVTYAVKIVEGEPGRPVGEVLLGPPHHVGRDIPSTTWTYPAEAPPLRPGAAYGVVVKGLSNGRVVALSGPSAFLFKWEAPVAQAPSLGYSYGSSGNPLGQPCNPEGATKTVRVKRTYQCRICDAVVVPMGWTPGAKRLYEIFGMIMKVLGAGKGVRLGEALAGTLSVNAGREIWVKLCWTVVELDNTYTCVNGKWDLTGTREADRGDLSKWYRLYNTDENVSYWVAGTPAAAMTRAVQNVKASAGCP